MRRPSRRPGEVLDSPKRPKRQRQPKQHRIAKRPGLNDHPGDKRSEHQPGKPKCDHSSTLPKPAEQPLRPTAEAGLLRCTMLVTGELRAAARHQGTGPKRSTKRPVPAVAGSVARPTIASVPSPTVWVPLCPLRSVAV